MDYKLLLINNNKSSLSRIKNLVNTSFPNVEIYSPGNSNLNVSILTKFFPDIILFDIDYPKGNVNRNIGFLQDIMAIKDIPTIVISSDENFNWYYDKGAVNFIHKPYTDITLVSNLKTAFNHIKILESINIKEREIVEKNKKIQFQIKNELKQRDIIIRKNKEIMGDIRYASRIQQAILPTLELMNQNIYEYFILHQPKSHVSGDFYWVSCHKDNKVIAVGDCTGHGISGGLMHMLGAVYLNEIVSSNNFKTASDILNQLRDHIMQSLNQTGAPGETQDGMDIALCIIDCFNKRLQFAGANNPLYLVRNKNLIEIKGDRMPVGIHVNYNKSFSNHHLSLESHDILYMFSDGFADQFGGPKGKKFRYKQFKELLVNISDKPMEIQKEILNNEHDKWRGSLDQIDDILVFGLKIK